MSYKIYKRQKKLVDGEVKELTGKLAMLPKIINLDKPINEEGDTLLELIPKSEFYESQKIYLTTEDDLKIELNRVMGVLDEREKIIVKDYFGLSGHPRTLAEIGKDFNLTKERIRQIKEKAIRRIKK